MIEDSVKGTTKVIGVIGNPISHTFSPVIHNTIARMMGHDAVYAPFHVMDDDLAQAIAGAHALSVFGLNVTIPHKQEVMGHLAWVDEYAKNIGAVNTLRYTKEGYKGYNTDIYGIQYTLKNNGVCLKDRLAVVLGAGGSAAAAVAACASEGASKIFIVNRTLQNAENIAENAKKYYNREIGVLPYEKLAEIEEAYCVIQTTSVGFSKLADQSPVTDKAFFKKAEVCLDMIYTPWETVFLKDAASYGLKAINGFEMLIHQAVAAYEIWFDMKLPVDFVMQIKGELSEYYQHVRT